MAFTGSPQKRLATSFNIYEDSNVVVDGQLGLQRSSIAYPPPLTTSKLMNQLPQKASPKDSPVSSFEKSPVEALLAKLSKQQAMQDRQARQQASVEDDADDSSSSTTDPYAADTLPTESIAISDDHPDAEVLRLKKELSLATERMAQMDLQLAKERQDRMSQAEIDELTQSRITQHTVEQALGSPFPGAQNLAFNMAGPLVGGLGGGMPASHATSMRSLVEPVPSYHRPGSGLGNGYMPGYTPPTTPFYGHLQPIRQPPIGTRLSPTAMEFGQQWPSQAPAPPQQTYMSTAEPLNYRRLLDRNMSCNWRYIVDKIVCSNDQQASIFLQQKLKVGTIDQKYEIVQAIIDQAYPLMVNRFGNFLVQRCFEHGTPEQVVAIAQAIRGNTLNLSMDAFGCHVVQKAFDCVPEEYKAIMVHELLRRIPETVIHRYACHVWQKLFELRWSGEPPQIMKYVNEALRGMWHEVALGETGSLVVQNIFENCLEEDKRPCINEVLSSIDVVAHGQFGNWCIQHICEHGSIPDRTRAVDHVLRFATEYSMDQFASKVVEKCLKIGSNDFLDRYLDRVCEGRQERPRMPLIDIAGDQFGNYLIQYVLTQSDPQRREVVAGHIRKHMVSLRGSKYGSRVAMLCCNPAYATRPGPPTGMPPSRNSSRYGGDYFGQESGRSYHSERQYGGMSRSFGGWR
ncbi:hypothetical protein B0A50_06904 [Salinomyces thailandicus]|uniref:PUM-HD domain-containing protein n=1 Tax=Salinomyces thailandicus TaxID=706561 RepID=A0A4U0TPL3_9PEZI|nr:hypothetical protein B0A50_06904 [Salinomyces thailandica]